MVMLALASLILVPTTIGAAGLETWASIVLGQALAQIAATIVGWGYGVNGPSIIATLPTGEGVSYFRLAESTRAVVAVPVFVGVAGAMYLIPNPSPIAGLLGGAPLALAAFSGSFFYIGRSAPRWFLLAETVPRVTFMLAGAGLLAAGAPLLLGLALPAAGTAVAVIISNVTIRMSARGAAGNSCRAGSAKVRRELHEQIRPVLSFALSNGASALPVLMVNGVAAHLVGPFGVFDRLQRQAAVAVSPLTATFQGWVPRRLSTDGTERPIKAALGTGITAAVAVMATFAVLGGPALTWLSAGELSPTLLETLLSGAFIATTLLVNLVAYACLVPLGGIKGVITTNVAGVIVSLLAIPLLLTYENSVASVLEALVAGNLLQLLLQMALLRRLMLRWRIKRNRREAECNDAEGPLIR